MGSLIAAFGSIGIMVAIFFAILVPVGIMMIDSKLNGIRKEARAIHALLQRAAANPAKS